MSCGCSNISNDGKAIVDLVRSKGKEEMILAVSHEIKCSCNNIFIMTKLVDKCPKCQMTYGVTPCSSKNKDNVKAADINY